MEVECFVTTEEIYQMIQELRKQAQKEQTENKITDDTEKEKTENTAVQKRSGRTHRQGYSRWSYLRHCRHGPGWGERF